MKWNIHRQLPLYDESTIRRYTASKVKELEENLLDINRIDSIIKEVYQDKLPEYITLGGNGASIKPVGDSSRSSIYAFEVYMGEKSLFHRDSKIPIP